MTPTEQMGKLRVFLSDVQWPALCQSLNLNVGRLAAHLMCLALPNVRLVAEPSAQSGQRACPSPARSNAPRDTGPLQSLSTPPSRPALSKTHPRSQHHGPFTKFKTQRTMTGQPLKWLGLRDRGPIRPEDSYHPDES